jgi:hypothetical protein
MTLRLPPFHLDADPIFNLDADPIFNLDADADPDQVFHFDEYPVSDPQPCFFRFLNLRYRKL